MKSVHPVYRTTPYQDGPGLGKFILRDGSVASVHPAVAEDLPAVQRFFEGLSERSLQRRFLSSRLPDEKQVLEMLDSRDLSQQCCLLVTRKVKGASDVIAMATYSRVGDGIAEFAATVSDAWQGRGMGTRLLERLSVIAVSHGIRHFEAYTAEMNRPMLDVFRHSGFGVDEDHDGGTVTVDLEVVPSEASVRARDMRDQVFTAASMEPFFHPRSVAVIGVSRRPDSLGNRLLAEIQQAGFTSPIYPIHPEAKALRGVPAYADIGAIEAPVDMAVICLPADRVCEAVEQCGKAGVRVLVVLSAGFAESGPDGVRLQEDVLELSREYGMRMLGPAALGIINTEESVRLNATFSPLFPDAGRIALASQSGAMGLALLALTRRIHLGLSSYVSMGNKADVSGNDLLLYWLQDEKTDAILLYLEGFKNPRRFARIARTVSRTKPIVCVKAGRPRGLEADPRASSTAILAGSDASVAALFRQTGVIRARTMEEMFDLARALSAQPLPAGRRMAILTNAGGAGVLCAQACEAVSLQIAEPKADPRSRTMDGETNPLDVGTSAGSEAFEEAVLRFLRCDRVDALIVIYIPMDSAEEEGILAGLGRGVDRARAEGVIEKPIYLCMMQDMLHRGPVRTPAGERLPIYVYPESVPLVIQRLVTYSEWRAKPAGNLLEFEDAHIREIRTMCRSILEERGDGWLRVGEQELLLKGMNLPRVNSVLIHTEEEAVAAAVRIGFPVVAKWASATLAHKTDRGGVCLNIADEVALRAAFHQLQTNLQAAGWETEIEGLLIQPMVQGGLEILMGVCQDPVFGPVLAFGLGGVHVEVIRDVTFRVTPLEDQDAEDMIREINAYPLLEGVHGHPAVDREAVKEILLRISMLVSEVPEIKEIDLNPVFALAPGAGCLIADARIRIAPAPGTSMSG